jgi:predicted amidohydrolase YtcJ
MTDTIILNARIRTMDPTRPHAQALAIRDGRVLALGHDAEIRDLLPGARRIDAGGRLVLPGFLDAHVHLMDGGTDLVMSAQLGAAVTVEDIIRLTAAHAAQVDGALVMGVRWEPAFFGDHNLTRDVVDRAVADRPCILWDTSFHNACINSAAIAMVGLTEETPDPLNGHFVKDSAGRLTGMLHEEAITWVRERLPQLGPADFLAGARAGQAHANRHGITGILDPYVVDRHVLAYGALAAEDALTLRVAGAASVTAHDRVEELLPRLVALRAAHGGLFQVNSAKFFFDGVMENRTGALIEPYADAAGGNAPVMLPPDLVAALFTALDAARFQIHVHVIGDMAARAALDGFAVAMAANGRWPGLHQLAHLQVVHPEDFARMAELGVMANVQPLWAQVDPAFPDPTLDMIGPARRSGIYAFRRMIDAGAAWCLSSDFSVSTLNPFEIIETAVTRQPRGGTAPAFLPEERLTVEEALVGYTTHAAAACWRGHEAGMLRPGLSGDVIVLDRDITTCDPHDIGGTEVLLTLFRGAEVWRDQGFGG